MKINTGGTQYFLSKFLFTFLFYKRKSHNVLGKITSLIVSYSSHYPLFVHKISFISIFSSYKHSS